jgi:hypothetical protein
MRTPDDAEFLDDFERSLERGIVEDREITVRLPLLGMDLLGISFRRFVASSKTYLVDLNGVDQEDGEDVLPPDNVIESENTSYRDLPPHS